MNFISYHFQNRKKDLGWRTNSTGVASETCAEAFEGARTELRLDGPSSARDVSECGPGCFDYLPGPLHEFERLTLGVSLSNLLVRQN